LVYNIIKCPLCTGSTIIFVSSKGIGTVKRKGLPVKAGYPAINPVPYKMIESAAEEELKLKILELKTGAKDSRDYGGYDGKIFFSLLYVPEGEKIAERTLNPRLGIEGGISILGTSGYVVPISTKAWLETIKACLSFLKANKIDTCVFTPGRFSEKAALKIFKNIRRESFIEIGDYVSYSLRKVSGNRN
jgi:Cobalamin biosynthesis protein CbiD